MKGGAPAGGLAVWRRRAQGSGHGREGGSTGRRIGHGGTGAPVGAGALAVDHGFEEAVLTVIGVSLVALGHLLNLRKT